MPGERIRHNIFEGRTTHLEDYRPPGRVERVLHTWPKERSEPATKAPPKAVYSDNESYCAWKEGAHVPFDLLWEPKPITGTLPSAPFKMPEVRPDAGREKAIETRPRVYMSPAISMDDVAEPAMREVLVKYMYTTDWRRAAKEAAKPITELKLKPSAMEEGGDPVALKVTHLEPPMEGKVRMLGKGWELEQVRGSVDPTRTFWLEKDPPIKCGACVNPYKGLVTQAIKDEIAHLVERDELRLAHDIPCPTYAGYQPRLSAGVCLKKVEMPVTHPSVSVSEAIAIRRRGLR